MNAQEELVETWLVSVEENSHRPLGSEEWEDLVVVVVGVHQVGSADLEGG